MYRVWGLGFGVWGLEFGVWGLGSGVWGLGFGVWCLVFGVWGLRCGVLGLGFRFQGADKASVTREARRFCVEPAVGIPGSIKVNLESELGRFGLSVRAGDMPREAVTTREVCLRKPSRA